VTTEEDKRLRRRCCEEVFTKADLAVGEEGCAEAEQEALARKIFGLALALATEPSKLGQCVRCWCISRNTAAEPSIAGRWGNLTNE
jgi:hypothetical protein